MTDINSNYYTPAGVGVNGGNTGVSAVAASNRGYGYSMQPELSLRDEFIKEHKKNGLVERVYNWLKNITKIGLGSKKVDAIVTKAENGEISEEQARGAIQKYRSSQADSAQIAGDAISIGTVFGTFFATKKYLVEESPKALLRKLHGVARKKEETKLVGLKIDWNKLRWSETDLINYFKNPWKSSLKLGLIGLTTAATAKWLFGIINRIGSKEFVTDKKDFNGAINPYDKAAYSQVRKFERKEKRKANFRNFVSGGINGVMMPITGLVGGLVGVPVYFIINSLNRYFIGNHTDDDKSFKGYGENLKNNAILSTGLTLGFGIPMFLKTHNLAVFEKYSKQAVKKLQNTKLNYSKDMLQGKSTYEEISDILLGDKEIKAILDKDKSLAARGFFDRSYQTEDEMVGIAEELIDKNFFAAKMKQISNDGSALARVLKEDLRPTRTYEQAQAHIDKIFGKGTYVIDKEHYCLGVGTVAETYFAKGKDGKDVCIKVVKDAITADKIAKDKEAFLKVIEGLKINPQTGKPITEAERLVLRKNVEDMAEGVLKEIDLENEFKAAEKLVKDTEFAAVVKGLAVKDNVYVMERANGISLESLMNLNEAYALRDSLMAQKGGSLGGVINGALGEAMTSMNMSGGSPLQEIMNAPISTEQKIIRLNKYIEKVEAKTPTHGNIRLEPEDLKNLINEYQQVLVEQFNKITESGKTIHGDIHPGNIFIDVDALRTMPKKSKLKDTISEITGRVNRKNHGVFTLIDTGNVIELTKEQSISLLNLSSYIEHGNYKKIAEYVLQGVEGEALGGHTKEEALKIVSDELKNCFIGLDTPLDVMTTDNVIKLTSNIMKKNNIIPNDTQLNLNKAIQSANNSYDALVKGLFEGRLGNGEALGQIFGFGEGAKDGEFLKQIKKNLEKAQEKENLRKMSAAEKAHQKKMDGNLHPNQEEYHIYKLKQSLYQKPEVQTPKREGFNIFDDFMSDAADDMAREAGNNRVIDVDFEDVT